MPEHPTIDAVLSRPIDQRIKEFKYRFAQATVFGLPVIALSLLGERLSNPAESQRWIAVFGTVLVGWIVFVAAAGMFSEGIMQLIARKQFTFDLLIATLAIGAYVLSVISAIGILIRGAPFFRPLLFHVVAIGLIGWCGLRWWSLKSRVHQGRSD